jgi:hypothetical protein
VVFSACKTKPITNTQANINNNINFTELESGGHSNIYEKRNYVINSKEELTSLYKSLNASRFPKIAIPKVDFTKNSIIALLMGSKSSGGHRIVLDHITSNGSDVSVYYREFSPKGMATSVMTQPYYLAVTSKINTEVTFIKINN